MSEFGRFVGLPFGQGPGEVTCWTLVQRILFEMKGIELPTYGEISARDLIKVARAMRDGSDAPIWHSVEEPRAFDVVLMRVRGGTTVQHVGLCTSIDRLLHVEEQSHAVMVPLRHFTVRGRILGFRRHEALV